MKLLLCQILLTLVPSLTWGRPKAQIVPAFYIDGPSPHILNSVPDYYYDYEDEDVPIGHTATKNPASNYQFSYGVSDEERGTSFSRSEVANDKGTTGQYQVELPDGRLQIVKYTADENGYRAEVTYEGEAVYDKQVSNDSPQVHQQKARIPASVHSPEQVHNRGPIPSPIINHNRGPIPSPIINHNRGPIPSPIINHNRGPIPIPVINHNQGVRHSPGFGQNRRPIPSPVIDHSQAVSRNPGFGHNRGPTQIPHHLQQLAIHNSPFPPHFIDHQNPPNPHFEHDAVTTGRVSVPIIGGGQFGVTPFFNGRPTVHPINNFIDSPPHESSQRHQFLETPPTNFISPTPHPHPIVRSPQPRHSLQGLPPHHQFPRITSSPVQQHRSSSQLIHPHPFVRSHARFEDSPVLNAVHNPIYRSNTQAKSRFSRDTNKFQDYKTSQPLF